MFPIFTLQTNYLPKCPGKTTKPIRELETYGTRHVDKPYDP
jgi:hypothetical protein